MLSVPFSGGQGSRIAMKLFGIRCLVHIQQCRFLPTEIESAMFWFMSESAPRLEDYIIIRECSSVIFGSCCVYSCMINPPILLSPTVSPHTLLYDCAEVCLTHVSQMQHPEHWEFAVRLVVLPKKLPDHSAFHRDPDVLGVESSGAFIPFSVRMNQDNCNRISSLCLVGI